MFVLNLNHPKDKIFFYSDFHCGHDRDFIWQPRGFTCVTEHDEQQFARWNQTVPEDAVVFLLGDTLMGMDGEARLMEMFKKLNFRQLYLMPGNHFSGLKQLRKKMGRNFVVDGKEVSIIENLFEIDVRGQFVVLSHYPIMSWNNAGKGAWMIHGHVHGKIATSLPDNTEGGKILDVGPESVGKPVSFAEVEQIMAKKPFRKIDHHG